MTMRYAHADEKHLAAVAKKFSVPKSVTTTVEAAELWPAPNPAWLFYQFH
jgi:hypothetical protein